MPSYQPKVSTKHKDYPCCKCGKYEKEVGAKNMFITGIDESNASITKQAITKPICRACFCIKHPRHNVCTGNQCCYRCGLDRKSQEIKDGWTCEAWGTKFKTHIWSIRQL